MHMLATFDELIKKKTRSEYRMEVKWYSILYCSCCANLLSDLVRFTCLHVAGLLQVVKITDIIKLNITSGIRKQYKQMNISHLMEWTWSDEVLYRNQENAAIFQQLIKYIYIRNEETIFKIFDQNNQHRYIKHKYS